MNTDAPLAPPSNTKRWVGLILSIGVSVAILAYLAAHLDWKEVAAHFRHINPWYIFPAIALLLVMGWMRALRWRLLLPNDQPLSTLRLFEATMVGFFASFVLPLRAGEVIRPLILSRWQPVSFSTALASILTERLADAICLLTFLLICLAKFESVPPIIMTGAQALGVLTLGLVAMVAFSYAFPGKVEAFLHRIVLWLAGHRAPRLAERLNHMIVDYFIGLRSIRSFGALFMVVFWSFTMWFLVAVWFHIVLLAFGHQPSLWVGMVLNVFVALAVAAPSAPGFLGTFQAGCLIAFAFFPDFTSEFGMAYSVVAHTIQFFFNITLGLIILHLRGLTLASLRRTTPPPATPPPPSSNV
ncbi:MAG TPA: lysylphosphatidylglycerol synthase transmembrane domain-containing protein [Kiritimatiellia bacterium]|nr:lysylphosphatidylglycerol synthase transmembrane domain-containing protein [Kiritimatiellia bacterium]